MERESFMDEEIAKYLNDHFVCIKVDREERPDVDAIYMMAVQIATWSRRLAHVGLYDAPRLNPSLAARTFLPAMGCGALRLGF